jgi:hypothetical protein
MLAVFVPLKWHVHIPLSEHFDIVATLLAKWLQMSTKSTQQ